MGITYRMANHDDFQTLTELYSFMVKTEENVGEDTHEEIVDMARGVLMNPDKAAMFLAFDGDNAIGFSRVRIRHEWFFSDRDDPFGYLETIYVRREYRRQGVAHTLVAMCEDLSRDKGCLEFFSGCDLDNEGSYAFHIGAGFKEQHRIIHFSKEL